MSDFTFAQAEAMARRYIGESFEKDDFEVALAKVLSAIEVIERCNGEITFSPPLNPAPGCVYGEEVKRNWLTG